MFKNFIKKLFGVTSKPDFIHGAILDDALTLHQQPQFTEMVASANPVNWQPLDVSKLPEYTIRNQNGSSSCVAFTVCNVCSILYFIRTGKWTDFSPAWVYSQRSNKPTQGMIGLNAFSIAQKGMLPDVYLPSDNKDEDYMNSPTDTFTWYDKIADVFGLDTKLVVIPIRDIETVASIIQTTGKPVMVWFQFGHDEWKMVPQVLGTDLPYAHSVTAIPPSKPGEQTFGIYEGEKAIVIQDQWGKDLNTINGKRIIKQSFFNKRNIFAAYPVRFKFDAVDSKPVYDGSITSLQNCLKYESCFPTNVNSTGVFGPITVDAIKKFQKKYSIQQTGTLGPITTKKIQELFS